MMFVVCHLVLTLSCAAIFLQILDVKSASNWFFGRLFLGAYLSSGFNIVTYFHTLKFFVCHQNVSTLSAFPEKCFQQRTSKSAGK